VPKYDRLASYLAKLACDEWCAEFREVERVLGFRLPRSARTYQAWWSNQHSSGHAQSTAWQSQGWRTANLDLTTQTVSFVRQQSNSAVQRAPQPASDVPGLTIRQAKAGLATHFGVSPDRIEITIKG
jgi:hypothetical protein